MSLHAYRLQELCSQAKKTKIYNGNGVHLKQNTNLGKFEILNMSPYLRPASLK